MKPTKLTYILLTLMAMLFAVPTTNAAVEHLPDYYDSNARQAYRQGDLARMKALIDEGLKLYPDVSALNELAGQYYLHHRDYDTARFYLYRALDANSQNTHARELMVDVEERTGNLSSAICYINEILEGQPYQRGWWLRKIKLYRRQGNDEEADHLLRRLRLIYPRDGEIQKEFIKRMDERYTRHREQGNVREQIQDLQELVDANLANPSHYHALALLYNSEGDVSMALRTTSRGLGAYPKNVDLIRLKTNILTQSERFGEAESFLLDSAADIDSLDIKPIRMAIFEERARVGMLNEPYLAQKKIYGEKHSREALDFLLNTSFTRGYDEDALYYIEEAKKSGRDSLRLLDMEYKVQKRLNNFAEARGVLERLYRMNPDNADVGAELTRLRFDDAQKAMSTGDYADALIALQGIDPEKLEPEVADALYSRMYTCYYNMNDWANAMAVLDESHRRNPSDVRYLIRKTDILMASGSQRNAIQFARSAIEMLPENADSTSRAMLVSSYEGVALPYIKGLIEGGALYAAQPEIERVLTVNPRSELGLRYAITVYDLLDNDKARDFYVRQAMMYYPNDMGFKIKAAESFSRRNDYRTAIDMVRRPLDSLPGNRDLVNAHSATSELYALRLIKEHQPDSALTVLDSALVFDNNNRQLLYAKGLAFEARKQYDSAYLYQRRYEPSPLELDEFKHHLRGLQNRTNHHNIYLEYIQGRYGDADVITSVATASYTWERLRDTWIGTINYAGRDGSDRADPDIQGPGGIGIQLLAGYQRKFKRQIEGRVTAGWASRYFPQFYVNVGASKELRHDWTLDLGLTYRRIQTYQKEFRWVEDEFPLPGAWTFDRWRPEKMSLFSLAFGATKVINDAFSVDGRIEGFYMRRHLYVNGTARGNFYPLTDRRTRITAMASVGTAPEASMIDDAMPGTFHRLNSMVGLGGNYLFFKNLAIGLLGTWHTFYNQNSVRQGTFTDYEDITYYNYRNLYNLALQVNVYF